MIERSAVRAIILNQTNDLLLVHIKPTGLLTTTEDDISSPINSFWITSGGAIEPGETQLSALIREIYEETGITESSIEHIFEPAAWYNEIVLTWKGVPTLFKETFFLVKVNTSRVNTTNNPDEHEKELIDEMRWWKQEDLLASQETFFPVGLPQLVAELLKAPPRETIALQSRK